MPTSNSLSIRYKPRNNNYGKNFFDLEILVGNWESINLNPTVMIHWNAENHQLSIIYMNETTKQASPSTYEIQENEDGYFMCINGKRASIRYCRRLDMLTITTLGDYMRS